ncbi:FimV/HubP family polar landmark protein [Pantoea sp. 18069]|uniref:FimV/HubP family polar landmark protein n=1 Tax=Pantoea sp. 18069 TaxID=2681415 RepID=UPI00135C93AE|nr:FimV/HubP family polar landmark protein [Pantoea sp. 18069]
MHRWKLSALAAAALVSVSLTATDAWALALGRISIQSALGEPLRAEVELPQITAAEADSLRATIATPAVFRAQGMEYTATASQFQVQLQRRPDGSAVLRLSSTQPVSEPFVDLVIDASWSAGHVVRSYTLLLDPPPSARQAAPGVTAAPQISDSAPAAQAPQAPASAPRAPARAAAPASPAAAPTRNAQKPSTLTIRSGDTASRLALAHRPAGVSLDQMLVAMLRANPHAFISGNVNRMTAGAVVEMPDQAAAQATSASEARQMVAAQSQDFNEYRRRLAGAAPLAAVTTAQRSASGNVEAQVQDRKASTTAPDKLTLSKGALQASQNADERLAQEKQAQSQSERLAELARNLNELQNVASATPAATAVAGAAATTDAPAAGSPAAGLAVPGIPAAGVPAAGMPATDVPAADTPAADTPAPDTQAAADGTSPAADAAATPEASTQAPAPDATTDAAPAAAAAAPAPAEAPAQAPGFIDTLREDPALPLAGVGLLALLLGYAGYRRVRQRRQQDAAGDSLLQADSFFAAGQGQQVDTAHTQFGSSTAYSHSQLDTGGEVDAVAEADVYLAYGRDLQAEEILKEALRSQPERLALHQKLADIYAKRQDRKAFEAVAQTVFALTEGQGAPWLHLAEQGHALDPENALYQPAADALPGDSAGAQTRSDMDDRAVAQASIAAALGGLAASALPPAKAEPAMLPDLDLDLPSGLADPLKPASALTTDEPGAQSPDAIDFEPIEPIWKQPASTTADTPAPAPELPAVPESAFDALADLPPVPPASATLPDPAPSLDNDAAAVDTAAADAPAPAPAFTLTDTPAPAPVAADISPPHTPASDLPAFELTDTDAPKAGTTPPEVPATPAAPAATPAPAPAFDFLEFDLGNLSLDLGDTAPADALSQSSQAAAEDPLATKLALAQEFAAIGDSDGARTLIEEVIEEAEGELKERAQRLLSEID